MSTNGTLGKNYGPLKCCDACGIHYTYLKPIPSQYGYDDVHPELTGIRQRLFLRKRNTITKDIRKLQLEFYLAEKRYKFEGFDCIADYLRYYYNEKRIESIIDSQSSCEVVDTRNCYDCIDLLDSDYFNVMGLRQRLERKKDAQP